MMSNLPLERLAVVGFAVGHCEWMFEETRKYVKERQAFGSRIADFQAFFSCIIHTHKRTHTQTKICLCDGVHVEQTGCSEYSLENSFRL